MNRLEFMNQLEALLKDVPADEKAEAIRYYNSYFDDAGAENESHIIEELEHPQKVAEMIKEGLHTGKKDTGSYGNDVGDSNNQKTGVYEKADFETNRGVNPASSSKNHINEKNNQILKIVLIILVVCLTSPVWFPIGSGLFGAVFGIIVAIIFFFAGIVIAGMVLGLVGMVLAFVGVIKIFSFPATGLLITGVGLILLVLGVLLTVLGVKLCLVVYPAMFRGVVNVFRKIVHRKE